MIDMSGVNNSLVQSQLANTQLRNNIGIRVAAKVLDSARMQGDMVETLLAKAAQIARTDGTGNAGNIPPTLSSVATGIGQNLDVKG